MAFLGDLMSIAELLKSAYDLYEGCASAPQEIRLAREHIHAMALCIEGVNSDIVNNPRSFVHQHNAVAKTRTHALKVNIGTCERALKRMSKLLGTYKSFKSKHVSLWDKYRWSTAGKQEIAECKSDLVFATSVLDMFLSKESLNVLWKLEAMMEGLAKKMAAFEVFDPHPTAAATGQKRPRAGSNVTRTIVVSLVLARLRKVLQTYRRKKIGGAVGNRKSYTGSRRPKTTTRTNSGFTKNTKRNQVAQSYATKLALPAPPPPYTAKPSGPRPRTPSPDFHYIPGGSVTAPHPRPIRRSSSMNRLLGRLNAKVVTPRQPPEFYACWRVGVGNTAIGLKTSPEFRSYKRGQVQLRKMGEAFKEASVFDSKAVTENHKGVKMLLKERNAEEAKKRGSSGKGRAKKWFFVSGRVVGRDPGKTGLVSVEKAFVVLVRR